METTLSESGLEGELRGMPDRVRGGERVVDERDGEAVAVIVAPVPKPAPVTGREVGERLGDLRVPGDGFADDIEAARAALLLAEAPAWSD